MRVRIIILYSCFLVLFLRADDLDNLVNDASEKLDKEAVATEEYTKKEYAARHEEIEESKKINKASKAKADSELTALLAEEAKMDRVPPTDGNLSWERVPLSFLTYLRVRFAKNKYRVNGPDACSGSMPEKIEWAEKDMSSIRAVLGSLLASAKAAQQSSSSSEQSAPQNFDTFRSEGLNKGMNNTEARAYANFKVEARLSANAVVSSPSSSNGGNLEAANALSQCINIVSRTFMDIAYEIEASYRCKPKLEEILTGKIQATDSISRVLAAKWILGYTNIPYNYSLDEEASDGGFRSCMERFKSTRLYKELYTEERNKWEMNVTTETALKKLKNDGTWFPSYEMYQWAGDMDTKIDEDRVEKLTNGPVPRTLAAVKELTTDRPPKGSTPDEILRHHNVIRRMKLYDPLYTEYLNSQRK